MASPLINIAAEYGHGTMLKVNPALTGPIEVLEDGQGWRINITTGGKTYTVGQFTGQSAANSAVTDLEDKLWP